MKLDLSKLKKISSDKNTTTFQHPDGHSIKIAHSRLQPKLRDELDKIPVHKAAGGEVKKYADGTPDAPVVPEDNGQQAPVIVNVGTQPSNSGLSGPPGPEGLATPQGPQPNQQSAPQQQVATPTPQKNLAAAPPQVAQAQAPNAPQQLPQYAVPGAAQAMQSTENQEPPMKAKVLQHALDWQNDLNNGHVDARTYKDLFENKGTLGKIGMIFGALAGGMGSGLTGQPNVMLEMMNKELQRDYDAQVKSKDNAQNYLRIGQAHALNKAQVGLTEQQARLAAAQSNIEEHSAAMARGTITAMKHLKDLADAYPVGSDKWVKAQQAYGLSSQMLNGKIADVATQAEAAAAAMNMPGVSGGQPVPQGGPINYDRVNQLDRNSKLKLPGAPNESDMHNIRTESADLDEKATLQEEFNKAYAKLADMSRSGMKLNKADVEAIKAPVKAQVAKIAEGKYSASASSMVDNMLPAEFDYGNTRGDKPPAADSFFRIIKSGHPTLDRFGVANKEPMSLQQQQQQRSAPQQQPQTEYKISGGKKYMRGPDGKAVLVK